VAETPYCRLISFAEHEECRIERIFVKKLGWEEIRFSWWPNGKLVPRPLDLPEKQLLGLIGAALKKGDVFSESFVIGLRALLAKE
jgi:hypothetical protein